MLGYVEIVYIYFFKFNFLFQGKERPAQTKCVLTKLRALLVSAEYDSAQC